MGQQEAIIYRGENRGPRVGFRIGAHESGLIYNDEHHAQAAINRHLGIKDKDGNPVRGSNISMNRHCVFGRRALRCLREGGVSGEYQTVGARF